MVLSKIMLLLSSILEQTFRKVMVRCLQIIGDKPASYAVAQPDPNNQFVDC